MICGYTGFGCDTSAVINILAHRDATQRAYIQQEYRTTYAEELSKRLISELSGKLEVPVIMLFKLRDFISSTLYTFRCLFIFLKVNFVAL